MIDSVMQQLQNVVELGGPVVAILLVLSVISLALALYKVVQFSAAGAGDHKRTFAAVNDWSSGQHAKALVALAGKQSVLEKIADESMHAVHAQHLQKSDQETVESYLIIEAEQRLTRLERGFRVFDSIAQIAPLLGLFGTVLGMIEAFQKLQDAGNSVDPSLLAGGIWVALLTTAVGLAVAMPTSLFLTYFESRVARERQAAELVINRIVKPSSATKNHAVNQDRLTSNEAIAVQ